MFWRGVSLTAALAAEAIRWRRVTRSEARVFVRVLRDSEGPMTRSSSTYKEAVTTAGDPYCPIEGKKRGPLAAVASLGVMAIGAGFLGYSLWSSPAPTGDVATSPTVSIKLDTTEIAATTEREPTPSASVETALAAATTETVAETPQPAPVETTRDLTATVEEAIARSRAARAPATEVRPTPATVDKKETASLLTPNDTGFAPRLKPTLAKLENSQNATDGTLTPRPKPSGKTSIATAATPRLKSHPPRPMRLGGVFLASNDDRPGPVFFENDLKRDLQLKAPAPVSLAADIDRGFGERRIKIARGENFVDALKRAGVHAADRNEAAYAFGKHYNLRRLRPGQEFALTLTWPNQTLFQLASAAKDPEARLVALEFIVDAQNRIKMARDKDGVLKAEKSEVPLMARTMAISGSINGSLFVSAKAQGAPDKVIADLANVFAYDVDFQREIFGGDEFEAIFDVFYDQNGEIVSSGDIIFARMKWRGRTKEKAYYRFAASHSGSKADYFDAAGQGAKRLLMKTPIDGARLSSGFGTRRHPISGYRRQHKGVDFAAPRGTPIYAAGDGVVERANRYGSFGNYIRIRHANGYKTAYAHLKGFRKGIRAGKRVEQGDVIGYVGSTGASTGPHLHYEVHLNGKAVNPQRLKIATGVKLRGADMERFKEKRDIVNAMRLPDDERTPLYAKDEDRVAENSL